MRRVEDNEVACVQWLVAGGLRERKKERWFELDTTLAKRQPPPS